MIKKISFCQITSDKFTSLGKIIICLWCGFFWLRVCWDFDGWCHGKFWWWCRGGGAVVVGFRFVKFFFLRIFLCGFCDCDETFEVGFVRFFDGSTMVLLYMVVPWICCNMMVLWWYIAIVVYAKRREKNILMRLMYDHKKHG